MPIAYNVMPSEKPNPSVPHSNPHQRTPMPSEIRITNARLKSLLVSLISFAIAAAASPLLFIGSLKAVLSGTVIVLFFLPSAVFLLYRAADARTKLVLNADGIRIVQAFAEKELDGVGAKSGSKTKRENVFYPWELVNSVVFVDPFPATLYLSSRPLREIEAELEELEAEQPLPDNATLEQMEARVAKYLRLSESMTRQRDFSITLPVMYLLHGKHLPDLIRTLAAEPDKSRRQAVLDGFCQTFFPKAVRAQTLAQPEPREFPVRLPAQVSIRSIGGGYLLANILCALMLIGSLAIVALIVRNVPNPTDIRELLPLLLFAAIAAVVAAACGWQFSRYRRHRAVLTAINRPEAQPWKLVAIPLYVAHTDQKTKRTYYFYPAIINGKTRKITLTNANFQPVRRHGQYLAFDPRHGGAPVPIEAELRNISGLNADERRELLRQIRELAAEF